MTTDALTFYPVPSNHTSKPLFKVTHKPTGTVVELHASSMNAAWANFKNWNIVESRAAYTVEMVQA